MLCQNVEMGTFIKLLTSLSPDITVCVRGRHAIGKSEGVYQAAAAHRSEVYKDPDFCSRMVQALGGEIRYSNEKQEICYTKSWDYDKGLPVVERRLSQMTEGDIIGLPELHDITDGVQVWRSTSFRPCDWLIQTCQFPAMLFLDERNRALPGVKQAVFQLADSKAFYGHKLHDESRIAVAENVGMNYQVEQSDPAEVSRWVTVELNPTIKEWLDWAKGRVHDAVIEFIRANENCLEHTKTFEAEKKYPDRRMWVKLDKECQRLGIYEMDNPNKDGLLYAMSGAFLGVEVGGKFSQFVVERDREISANDVMKSWPACKKRLSKGKQEGIAPKTYIEIVAKIDDWMDNAKNKVSVPKAKQVAAFMYDCPAECRLTMFAALSKNQNNLLMVYPFIEKLMVNTATGISTEGMTVEDAEKAAAEKKAAGEAKVSEKKTTRGRKKK